MALEIFYLCNFYLILVVFQFFVPMTSFSEQIAQLVIPDPQIDPEDDINEDTRARLVDKDLLDSDLDEPILNRNVGKLKKSLALSIDDPKYEGKIVSRKDVNLDANEVHSETNHESDDGISESDADLSNDNEDEFEDEEIDSDEAMLGEDDDEPDIFRGKPQESTDKEKGKDTMNQISLWESLLEARIKIQKLLGVANQLPRPSVFSSFLDQGGEDLTTSIKSTTSSLTSFASEMFKLQGKLLDQIEPDSLQSEKDLKSSDAFISETWNETIAKRSVRLRKRRNDVLKFCFERPTVDQIEQILSDRDRLIRRTRVQRTEYRALGTTPEEDQADEEEDEHNSHLKETDEVFDDDDFYQQLLRQLIEQKTTQSQPGSSDAMQNSISMTRNWLKLQHLTTKQKKVVDTKASKGRKVRYTVHSKVVSFMAPVDKSTWSHESRNQLVKTLFSKSLASNVSSF